MEVLGLKWRFKHARRAGAGWNYLTAALYAGGYESTYSAKMKVGMDLHGQR